jgi:DNA polymerase III delta prime subunit
MTFTKAKRNDSFIKLALSGPSGSGKTFSALKLARGLVGPSGRIAYIDTENESAKLYSDLTEFFHCDLTPPFEYRKFIEAVENAEQVGFDCVVIDSLSHLWQGTLDYKSNLDRKGGNSFTNWNDAGKHFNEVIQTILQVKTHVIACLRVKQEYVLQEEVNAKGKTVQVPKKVGTAPVIRDNIEYEFTTVLEIGMDHNAAPSKDRTGLFIDKTFRINERTGEQIALWLSGNLQSKDYSTETDHFLQMIHEGDSKESLGKIGHSIKDSTLPEHQKDIIRNVYGVRYRIVA